MQTTNAKDISALWATGHQLIDETQSEYQGIQINRHPIRHFPYHRVTRKLVSWLPPVFSPGFHNPDSPWVPRMMHYARTIDEKFDLVHCTALPYDGILFPALRLAKRLKVPLICTPFVHLGEKDNDRVVRHYSRPQQIRLLQQCQAVIVQTQQEYDFLAQRGITKKALHIIPQGLEKAEVAGGNAAKFRKEHNITGPIIAHIAPLCKDKGGIDLVKAFTQLNPKHQATLVLVGKPDNEFNSLLDSLPVSERSRIIPLENIKNEERNDLLAAMDLLALPSCTDSFGMVFLEAWFYGKPVIGADAGGIPGVVSHDQTGLLVPYGSPEALKEALEKLLTDPQLCCKLGEAGEERLRTHYQWNDIKKQLVALFEEIKN